MPRSNGDKITREGMTSVIISLCIGFVSLFAITLVVLFLKDIS